MSSTANATWRIPGVFAGACPLSPWFGGEWNFVSSSRPLPSGVCIIAMSARNHDADVVHPLDSHVLDGKEPDSGRGARRRKRPEAVLISTSTRLQDVRASSQGEDAFGVDWLALLRRHSRTLAQQ